MSACFEWTQKLGGADVDARARKQANSALEDFRRGYNKLTELDMPEGSAKAIVSIFTCMRELEGLVASARPAMQRPWFQPLRDERAEWAITHHAARGALLRAQVCKAIFEKFSSDWS